MTVYAVGDVQGCLEPLRCVLSHVGFDPTRDQVWFVGDLVNRGPHSLEVLRLVRSLGDAALTVLGNHDLHLVQVADGARALKPGDTLDAVLAAPDAPELIAWLRQQPLLHFSPELGACLVHAGIPPHWDLTEALANAREAERWVRGAGWCVPESGAIAPGAAEAAPGSACKPEGPTAQRMRAILDYFTRMRFCDAAGRLELHSTGAAEQPPSGYLPWFAHPARKTQHVSILFGHWAALNGRVQADNVQALDTGCVWGRELTLMRLVDGRRFACSCAGEGSRGSAHVD